MGGTDPRQARGEASRAAPPAVADPRPSAAIREIGGQGDPSAIVLCASVTAVAAYLLVLHWLVVSRAAPFVAIALIGAPWCFAVVPAMRTRRGTIAVVAGVVAGVVATVATARALYGAAGASVGAFGPVLQAIAAHVDTLLYLENSGFMIALAALFATSLRPGREPLVTRLARVVRGGDMPDAVTAYTRVVTIAWAAFFAIAWLVSTLLFVAAPRVIWSGFVNLSLWPLVAAMFAIEYAVRLRVLSGVRHVPMMTGVDAFRRAGREAVAERRIESFGGPAET